MLQFNPNAEYKGVPLQVVEPDHSTDVSAPIVGSTIFLQASLDGKETYLGIDRLFIRKYTYEFDGELTHSHYTHDGKLTKKYPFELSELVTFLKEAHVALLNTSFPSALS